MVDEGDGSAGPGAGTNLAGSRAHRSYLALRQSLAGTKAINNGAGGTTAYIITRQQLMAVC